MRKSVLAGALACALVFMVSAPSASANSTVESLQAGSSENTSDKTVVALLRQPGAALNLVTGLETNSTDEAAPPPEPVKHQVKEHETLSDIAEQHQTTWRRLFDKNTQLADPNIINPGDELIVPAPDEQLEERALPVVAPKPKAVQGSRPDKAVAPKSTGSVAGNGYTPGYCTWYVKNRRPDLPNNLGNAYAWVSNAAAQGLPTGSTPRVGAAGQRGNHVVYVESVNSDGTVTISEMNHKGLYVMTTRTLPAEYFSYIY